MRITEGELALRGYDENAVALYGTSLERLNAALEQGYIPWNHPNGAEPARYQERLTRGGYLLYYTFGIAERIDQFNPDFVKKMQRSRKGLDPELNQQNFAYQTVKEKALGYSYDHAVRDHFHLLTGIYAEPDCIFYFCRKISPSYYYSQGFDILHSMEYEIKGTDPEHLIKFQEKTRGFDLGLILPVCLDRKGVILYFNNGIFNYQALPGYEDDREVMVRTKTPLPINVLSGIEYL